MKSASIGAIFPYSILSFPSQSRSRQRYKPKETGPEMASLNPDTRRLFPQPINMTAHPSFTRKWVYGGTDHPYGIENLVYFPANDMPQPDASMSSAPQRITTTEQPGRESIATLPATATSASPFPSNTPLLASHPSQSDPSYGHAYHYGPQNTWNPIWGGHQAQLQPGPPDTRQPCDPAQQLPLQAHNDYRLWLLRHFGHLPAHNLQGPFVVAPLAYSHGSHRPPSNRASREPRRGCSSNRLAQDNLSNEETMGVIRKKTATRVGEGGVKYHCDVCSVDVTSTVGFHQLLGAGQLSPCSASANLSSRSVSVVRIQHVPNTISASIALPKASRTEITSPNHILTTSSNRTPSPSLTKTGAQMKNFSS